MMVAESGIRSRADIDRLMAAGYEAFLVGEHLMRSDDPADALWALIQPAS
jgi:indole-3-glycerol phosphate synthase